MMNGRPVHPVPRRRPAEKDVEYRGPARDPPPDMEYRYHGIHNADLCR